MSRPTPALGFALPLGPSLGFLILAQLWGSGLEAADAPAHRTALARDGQALQHVVVSSDASQRVRAIAEELAAYLKRIASAGFRVEQGAGSEGIVVGLPRDFPAAPLRGRWAKPTIQQREDYVIHSHAKGVYLLGATELAVEHAVWDFLYRLGYRQFFPGDAWEIVPRRRDLSIAADVEQSPDYRGRRIWYGFGPWDYAGEPYQRWCARNRAVMGVRLNTGHAYGGVIRANQAEFDKHPEYYALLDGKRNVRPQAKLCIGNAGLRRLVAQYALRRFSEDAALDSISLDPSDGGGWCECEACRKIGSPSDRAVRLANDVATALEERFPDKLLGMYAYNYHSPPPHLEVHPQVVISVATAFIKGGLKLDDLLEGWSKQGATLGIREYYSVNTWDRDMPGKARGSRIEYLKQTIPEFYRRGARYLSAESSDNWGPNGLGYFLAARMMWDVTEAQHTDGLIDDFLAKCFGPARAPMREFYEQLDGSRNHLVFDDQLGRMFRSLAKAREFAQGDAAVEARLDDLLLYARYVDLYNRYAQAAGPSRQAAFETLIRHTYRMRKTMMVHAKAAYRDIAARDKSVSVPNNAAWSVPEAKNPWKSSEPFSREELDACLREGVERHALVELDFEPVEFSSDLVPSGPLQLREVAPGGVARGRGVQTFHTFVEKAPAKIELQITGGLIKHYRDRGNVQVRLWKLGGPSQTGEQETLVAEDRSAPPDGKPRRITLLAQETGPHRITVSDGGDMTSVTWPRGTRVCYKSSLAEPINTNGRWTLFFYVPKGTKVIGLFGAAPATIVDPRGKPALKLKDRQASFHSIRIPAGSSGKLWSVRQAAGAVRLLTVPPYLARSGAELLLPREVVTRDAGE